MGRAAAVAALFVLVAACSSQTQDRILVGAGTTLVDSHFMGKIVAAYAEVEPDVDVAVIGLSTAESIAFASADNVDVMITHERSALDVYLESHPASLRFDVFASSFVLAADPSIPLEVASLDEALALVAQAGSLFVSRDDGSGTNAAELAAWNRVGIDPTQESWYVRTGSGMGATLLVTDQKRGVTLSEEGAFLASMATLTLVGTANTSIPNPYDLTVVDTSNNVAKDFASWLISQDGVAAIQRVNDELFGKQVYATP